MNLNQQFLDVGSNPLAGKKILFTPQYPPYYTASYTSIGDSYQFVADSTGTITGSIVSGVYAVNIANPLPATNFYLIANETGSYIYSSSASPTGSVQCVVFDLINLIKNPFGVKKVSLTPQWSYPFSFSGSIIALASTSSLTDNNGLVTFTSMVPGPYLVDCYGKIDTSFYISIPSWSGSGDFAPCWNVKDLIIVKPTKAIPVKLTNLDNSYVLTVSSSDARYYPINGNIPTANTSSWALNAISSSYALTASFAFSAGSASHANLSDTASYVASVVSASYAATASYALNGGSGGGSSLSASWASQSLSASYVSGSNSTIAGLTASVIASKFTDLSIMASAGTVGYNLYLKSGYGGIGPGGNIIISPAGGNLYSGSVGIANNNPQYTLDVSGDINFTGNLYSGSAIYVPPTASYALTASLANAISFVPSAAASASWVSASVTITTAQTASYVTSSNITGKVSSALTADTASSINFVPSAATSASWVSASAFITTAQTASFVTASNVVGKVTSALNADTASSINFVPSAATSASFATTAQSASNIYVSASTTNAQHNILFCSTSSTPYHNLRYDYNQALTYNPSTDTLIVSNLSCSNISASAIASTVGMNWVTQSMYDSTQFNGGTAMAYGNGQFVVSGYGPYWSSISNDGVSWTTGSSNMGSANWDSMCYGNGLFVACGDGLIAISTDGLNWTTVSNGVGNCTSVTYGNGVFVVVGGYNAMYSYDGINWHLASFPNYTWYSVTFGFGRFVAVSPNGKAMLSYDGINWSLQTCPNHFWTCVAYGNGIFVATVLSLGIGNTMYSRDGIVWMAGTCPQIFATSMCYGEGVFVCGGSDTHGYAMIIISTDGITWTTANLTPSLPETIQQVTYARGVFVALTNTLGYYTSGKIDYVVPSSNNSYYGGMTLYGTPTASVNTLTVNGNISCSAVTASLFYGTSSYAISASWAPQTVITTVASASWVSASVHIINSDTASCLNTNTTPYVTLSTGSTNGITCSLSDFNEYVSITVGQAYFFTSSNPPSTGYVSNTLVYINNTITGTTASLSFPAGWTFMGSIPTSITASKNAMLSLQSFGGNSIAAVWSTQY